MEGYIKKISFLGENIQTIRKHRGMKQQELADKIGINMQSLSKIERGVNYPTFDTLEKIMDVLGVTPNELLSGEWKYIDHTEPYIMDIIKREQDFNVSLDYLSENEFFDDEKECTFYKAYKLIQYIHNYITNEVMELEELMEIKQLIQRQKLERMIKVHKEMRGGWTDTGNSRKSINITIRMMTGYSVNWRTSTTETIFQTLHHS